MNCNIVIPGLKDVMIKKVEDTGETINIYVEMPKGVHRCPKCGRKTSKIHDYRIQKIKHLKWFERRTFIFYRRRRLACTCGKRFSEENTFVKKYQRATIEWNQAVYIRAIKGKTFKETAEQYGTSISTIIRRFDQLSQRH